MQTATLADKIEMQHRLFAALSDMLGREVPLYDKSLEVNRVCNTAVCALLSRMHGGFSMTAEQVDATSGERHGAVRIGTPDEFRWLARFMAAFAMEPHNYYDMTKVGSKSQPIVATAFRSAVNPSHRLFSSLLQTDYFDEATQRQVEELLAKRQVCSDRARELIEKSEGHGGLDWDDAEALIGEATGQIFRWTGKGFDYPLYTRLCESGFKIAADVACFPSHHLNHLTPNTLCMDLYTSAMKLFLGEIAESDFRLRAILALERLAAAADADWMRLHFRDLTPDQIGAFRTERLDDVAGGNAVADIVSGLVKRFQQDDLRPTRRDLSGYKDFTEGPSEDTLVFLRQDSYKALTEPVEFTNPDGSVVKSAHTARFGEIEQRFYATTPTGRSLYDRCLASAEAMRDADPGLPARDFTEYQACYRRAFAPFPKTLDALLRAGLVYGRYTATSKGRKHAAASRIVDRHELVRLGYARVEGLRFEDFLPVSAAGIFASNLAQYGTRSAAAAPPPERTLASFEEVIGRPVIDSDGAYHAEEAESLVAMYEALGLIDLVPAEARAELDHAVSRRRTCPGSDSATARRPQESSPARR